MSDTKSRPVPAGLRSFAELSGLLPGEGRRDFEAICQAMIDHIQPKTNLECLWIFDLVELSWEILRYRTCKQKILQASGVTAIESILWRPDAAGMPELPPCKLALQHRQRQNPALIVKHSGFDR